MPIEINVEEEVISLGGGDVGLSEVGDDYSELEAEIEANKDNTDYDNFQPEVAGGFTINDIFIPYNPIEVVQRGSNAVVTMPSRGSTRGNYALRSKYSEDIYTITLPIVLENNLAAIMFGNLIDDFKTFGFVKIEGCNSLPEIPECFGIYSLDEFRISIDHELLTYILELDVQPVNMSLFGQAPYHFQEEGSNKHVGDIHPIPTLDELVFLGDEGRPTLEGRLEERSSGNNHINLDPLVASNTFYKNDTEFRAFLDQHREGHNLTDKTPTNYDEEYINGAFDLDFGIPVIYPRDGAIYQDRPFLDSDTSIVEYFETSLEKVTESGDDFRIVKLVDIREKPEAYNSEDGTVRDSEGQDITHYYTGNEDGVSESAKRTREFIIRYVNDGLAFNNITHNVKSLSFRKGHRFARHFIGDSSVPMTQYIGPKPGALSIVSHYTSGIHYRYYDAKEDVPQFFSKLIKHVDDNNHMYPPARAFNFIKIKDNAFGYISGKYIPADTYRVASASNSNVEIFATNFIESDLDDIYEESKFKLATNPVNANSSREAAKLIAKYLPIAEAYLKGAMKDPKEKHFHENLIRRLLRLKRRIESEAKGELLVLDGFERNEFIDPVELAKNPPQGSSSSPAQSEQAPPSEYSNSKIVILGDSIARKFYEGLSDSQKGSNRIVKAFNSGLAPKEIFKLKGGLVKAEDLVDSLVIVSSGISSNTTIKDEELADYIIALAKQVKHVHVLGVASNFKGMKSSELVNKLNNVMSIVKYKQKNVSQGGSSKADDELHPNKSAHTAGYALIKDAGVV